YRRLFRSVRSSTCSAGSGAALLLAPTFLLLPLELAQIVVQAAEALFPETVIVLQPVCGALERTRLEPAGPPLRLAPARDQTGALQHFQVLGDGGEAHLEGPGQ